MPTILFVPLNDDLLEQHPEFLHERLVPYRTDLPCFHALSLDHVAPEVKQDPWEARHASIRVLREQHVACFASVPEEYPEVEVKSCV